MNELPRERCAAHIFGGDEQPHKLLGPSRQLVLSIG
jgi:hypothetical protein